MIKYPGGEMAFWSILFILAGSFVSGLSFSNGQVVLGSLFAVLPIGCILIWFDVRSAKWLVVAYLSLAVLACTFMLFQDGFKWGTLFRGLTALIGAITFATWNGGPNSD